MRTVQAIDPLARPASGTVAEALRSSAGLPDDLGRALFLMLTTLMRPWELVSAAKVEDGHLHLPHIRYGAERTVPLGHFAGCVVGPEPASILAALGLRAGAEVEFLARLQRASHDVLGVGLEQLWASALEALVCAAPSAPERTAVFAYAGVGAQHVEPALLPVVPVLIDAEVRSAGFE